MNQRKVLAETILVAAALIMVFSIAVPHPVHADPNLGFSAQYQPDNPDGSWNVGSTVHLVSEPSVCDTVQINWGDGTVQQESGSYLLEFEHAYSAPGTYTVTATELCSGGGTGYLTITIEGGFGGLDLQYLAGIMGVLFGLLGIGLAVGGPSLKVGTAPPPPAEPSDGTPAVDLDKKVGLLKTDQEVEDQTKFFDQQRKGWDLPDNKVYVDRVSEVVYRTRDDPLARWFNPELVFIASAANVLDPDVPKAKYDPDTNRYYYDFHSTEDQGEAITEMIGSGLETIATPLKYEMVEGMMGKWEYAKIPFGQITPETVFKFNPHIASWWVD